MLLIRGQKIKLHNFLSSGAFELTLSYQAPFILDWACFALDEQQKLSDERYMIFYNQPQSPCQALTLRSQQAQISTYHLDLNQLPVSFSRVVFTAAIDGNEQMAQLQALNIQLRQHGQTVLEFPLTGTTFEAERAVILLEFYRKDGWRMAAVGQGFAEGLAALIRHFGGEVADEKPQQSASMEPPATESALELKKKLSLQKAEQTGNCNVIELTKKSLLTLEKKKLLDVQARVVLVLDASGSMNEQYRRGDVQQVVERLLPLAIHFDDDGSFECWAFAQKTVQLDDVNLRNINGYIEQTHSGWKNWRVGLRINEEIPAIQAVIDHYKRFQDGLPVYVLFISDGGVGNKKQMQKILTEAAQLPIFWQFVGVGGWNYGALETLNEMRGRVVDNCNFFAIDHINALSDEDLYAKLLHEFPDWIQATKRARIAS